MKDAFKPLEMYKALVDEASLEYKNGELDEKMKIILDHAKGVLSQNELVELKNYSCRKK